MESTITHIQPILAMIAAAGGRPLIVGGAVRDSLLGIEVKDIDIEVYRIDVDQLARAIEAFGRVDAVGRSFGILKLRLPDGGEVDFALPRRESKIGIGHRGFLAAPDPTMTPYEAASRRDFTWNALALTPDGELLDFFGGVGDLRARIIRHTTAAFAEDPLRVLRAMQFAARFDMRLAPETAELCRALLPEAAALAKERIWGEWLKWALKGRRPSAGLQVLRETGWITLYPELDALLDCPQDPLWHPEGDVWKHTLHVCDAAAMIADREGVAEEKRAVLLLAALCHDLGKPATTTHDPDGRIRSLNHAHAGIATAASFLQRIGCPRGVAAQVAPLVAEHMAHIGAIVSERTARRLALRLLPATITMWGWLVEADHSGRPPLPPHAPGAALLDMARRIGAAEGKPAPILQGRHLIAAGLTPGPRLGAILRQAYQLQIDGAFATVEEGLQLVQQLEQEPSQTP